MLKALLFMLPSCRSRLHQDGKWVLWAVSSDKRALCLAKEDCVDERSAANLLGQRARPPRSGARRRWLVITAA